MAKPKTYKITAHAVLIDSETGDIIGVAQGPLISSRTIIQPEEVMRQEISFSVDFNIDPMGVLKLLAMLPGKAEEQMNRAKGGENGEA